MFKRNRKSSVVADVQINLLRKKLQHQQHKTNVLVLDSAHSWIICFANFILMTMGSAFGRTISMTFLDFVEDFQVSITNASLGYTLQLVCFSLSSMLVTSLVIPKTGERIACIFGTGLGSLCTIGIGWSPNIACFLIFMALKGVSTGTTAVASIALISQYFEKRKSFATAVACSGLALGSMGAPPMVKLLIEMYGRRGTFLLLGALEMNNISMSMLLRPTTRYTSIIRSGHPDISNQTTNEIILPDISNQTTNEIILPDTSAPTTNEIILPDTGIKTTPEIIVPNLQCEQNTFVPAHGDDSPVCNDKRATEVIIGEVNINLLDSKHFSQTVDIELTPNITKTNETGHFSNILNTKLKDAHELKTCIENDLNSNGQEKLAHKIPNEIKDFSGNTNKVIPIISNEMNDQARSNEVLFTSSSGLAGDKMNSVLERLNSYDYSSHHAERLNSYDYSSQRLDILNSYDFSSQRLDRLNSYDYSSQRLYRLNSYDYSSRQKYPQMGSKMSTLNVSSTWSVISTPVSDVLVGLDFCALQETSATCDKDQINTLNKSCFTKFIKWLHGAFNIHLFRTWSLRALLLYNMTGVLVLYLSTYFPTIGAKSGLTNDEIALMLIVSGGVDFVSRLSFGAFSDLHVLSNTQIVAIAQIIIGTASHFTHFYSSFEALLVLAVIIGVFGGVRQTFGTLICLQFMGAEKYVQALGFQTMTATLTMAIHHPLLSSFLEVSGSFNPPLHYVGVAAYMSAIILLLEPYIKRMDANRDVTRNRTH